MSRTIILSAIILIAIVTTMGISSIDAIHPLSTPTNVKAVQVADPPRSLYVTWDHPNLNNEKYVIKVVNQDENFHQRIAAARTFELHTYIDIGSNTQAGEGVYVYVAAHETHDPWRDSNWSIPTYYFFCFIYPETSNATC